MDFETEPLSALPPGCVPDAVTSDGHAVCFWPQDDGRMRFVWDDQIGEPFDDLVVTSAIARGMLPDVMLHGLM